MAKLKRVNITSSFYTRLFKVALVILLLLSAGFGIYTLLNKDDSSAATVKKANTISYTGKVGKGAYYLNSRYGNENSRYVHSIGKLNGKFRKGDIVQVSAKAALNAAGSNSRYLVIYLTYGSCTKGRVISSEPYGKRSSDTSRGPSFGVTTSQNDVSQVIKNGVFTVPSNGKTINLCLELEYGDGRYVNLYNGDSYLTALRFTKYNK